MATDIPEDVREFVDYASSVLDAAVARARSEGKARDEYMYYPLHVRAVPKGKPKFYDVHGPPVYGRKYGYTVVRIKADESRGLCSHAGTKPFSTLSRAKLDLDISPEHGIRLNKAAREEADERRSRAAVEIAKRRRKPDPVKPLTRADGTPLQIGDILYCDYSHTGLEHNHVFYRLVAIGKTLRVRPLRTINGVVTHWINGHYSTVRPDVQAESEDDEICVRLDGHVKRLCSWKSWYLRPYDPTQQYVDESRADS